MIVRARACSLYKCVCLRFLMNLEVEETPRGILMRPLSMLWFVPDGCVKYWCDHGALRDYRLCHSSAASTVLKKNTLIVNGCFILCSYILTLKTAAAAAVAAAGTRNSRAPYPPAPNFYLGRRRRFPILQLWPSPCRDLGFCSWDIKV